MERPDSVASAGDIGAPGVERQPERERTLAAELLIRVRVSPAQLMIEVRDAGDLQLAELFELAQDVQQRHRIGPARQRDEHTGAARKQVVLPDRAQHPFDERHMRRREDVASCLRPCSFYRLLSKREIGAGAGT